MFPDEKASTVKIKSSPIDRIHSSILLKTSSGSETGATSCRNTRNLRRLDCFKTCNTDPSCRTRDSLNKRRCMLSVFAAESHFPRNQLCPAVTRYTSYAVTAKPSASAHRSRAWRWQISQNAYSGGSTRAAFVSTLGNPHFPMNSSGAYGIGLQSLSHPPDSVCSLDPAAMAVNSGTTPSLKTACSSPPANSACLAATEDVASGDEPTVLWTRT